MSERVYWDSCCFIDWIENKRKDRLDLLRPVVDAAINGHVLIIASTFAGPSGFSVGELGAKTAVQRGASRCEISNCTSRSWDLKNLGVCRRWS